MKILMSHDGKDAINTAVVERIYIGFNAHYNTADRGTCIVAETANNSCVLQIFDSGDKDRDMTAAKKYLVELVDKLNDGVILS